jgi:nitric oxide reductase NorE protein
VTEASEARGMTELTWARPATAGSDGTRRLPGDSGVWVFILADTTAFGLFFLLFTWGRMGNPSLYRDSARHLSVGLGVLNTFILLTSGALMALAVEAARRGERRLVLRYVTGAIGVGLGFAVTKVFEYSTKIKAGFTLLTNDFFMYYYVLTGVHFLHFAVGIVVLLVLRSKARRDAIDARFGAWIESGASYWHMVDLLWIMLFPLLYLQR